MNILGRLRQGLEKTRNQIASALSGSGSFDEGFYDSLEEALIMADVGLETSTELIAGLKKEIATKGNHDAGRGVCRAQIDDCRRPYRDQASRRFSSQNPG